VKYFVVFLLFLTVWIILACLVAYLTRRPRTPVLARGFRQAALTAPALPTGRTTCCNEVPCSAACAAERQRMRELLDMDYGRVTAELRKIIELGNDTDGAYPANQDL
jgi:hypothetical protein